MSRNMPTLFLLLLVLLGTACRRGDTPGGETGALAGKLVLTGSSTVAPLAGEIGRRFEALHPETRIDVQTGGSSRGIADARSGVADIGMASRRLRAEEADLHAITIARDGICLVVHRDNPIAGLDEEQVVGIYTGSIRDWAEVGGSDGPITVVNKAAGRATLEVFLDYFGLEVETIAADVIIGDNQQGIKTVAGNPGAIAYVSIGAADYDVRQGTPIKLLTAGPIAPTTENVAAGHFPITRPLNLLVRDPAGVAPPSSLTRAFLDFARSPEVHDLIAAQFFVPASSAAIADATPGTDTAETVTTSESAVSPKVAEAPTTDVSTPQG